MKQYSFLKGLLKALTAAVAFGAPLFILNFPELADMQIADALAEVVRKLIGPLSIGGAIMMVVNWLKVRSA
jgi:hypothetical protein